MIRVVIVDNEPLIRAGLQHVLGTADDITVAATAPVAHAVETIQAQQPGVVLLDSCTSDAEALSTGMSAMTTPPLVCVLSASLKEEHVATALAAGASGYVLKDTPPERLAPLVRGLAQGWTMMSAGISERVVSRFLGDVVRRSTPEVSRLSPRERKILVLVACGLSNTEIGLRLHLSRGTVKDHLQSILRKLNVERRVQAALIAERAGLVPPGIP